MAEILQMVVILNLDSVSMKSRTKYYYYRKKSEDRINSFPQWTTEIEGLTIHFVGLFSEKKDAIPILLCHGWPGGIHSAYHGDRIMLTTSQEVF